MTHFLFFTNKNSNSCEISFFKRYSIFLELLTGPIHSAQIILNFLKIRFSLNKYFWIPFKSRTLLLFVLALKIRFFLYLCHNVPSLYHFLYFFWTQKVDFGKKMIRILLIKISKLTVLNS